MSEELIGRVMVDSGQIMIGDPCYLRDWAGHEFNGDGKLPNGQWEYSYDGACNATCSPSGTGELQGGFGVVTGSGYGDGAYPVYVKRDHNNRVVSVTVYFDVDHNEDDSFEDEEEQDRWLNENDE